MFDKSKGAKIRNRYNQVPHLTQDKTKSAAFSNFVGLSISEGSVLPDYLEVATAVVVPHGVDRNSKSIFIFSLPYMHRNIGFWQKAVYI